jgi:gliding motility-associated transport system ATP-binding protein
VASRPAGADAPSTGEIRAERLCKWFGATVAVRDVSFEVARGEVVGFLGPNGAGKSTTLRMLTGVFPPSSGRAAIAGHDVVREPLVARRALGYLPERTALYGDMSVTSYLAFVAEMKQIAPRELRAAVGRAMGAAGIERVANRLVGNLSKGFRQRVGIAQALLGEPPVLILDEPTSGLDPEQVAEIRSLIRGLGESRTVILSTHILPEVESICSRVMIMNGGRILAVDAPHRLERRLRPYHELATRVAGAEDALRAALGGLSHVVEVIARREEGGEVAATIRCEHGVDMRGEIAERLVAAGLGLLELRPIAMTLEEIFLALVHEPAAAEGAASPGPRAPF